MVHAPHWICKHLVRNEPCACVPSRGRGRGRGSAVPWDAVPCRGGPWGVVPSRAAPCRAVPCRAGIVASVHKS